MKNSLRSSRGLYPRLIVQGSGIATAAAFLAFAAPAHAAGTLAGTDIVNEATASYDVGAGTASVTSNINTIKVDELLDVVVTGPSSDIVTTPGATENVHRFQVVNTGNGTEAFTLTANVSNGGDNFDPSLVKIVLDTNGNGAYDPGVDTDYVAGTNNPSLLPDTEPTGSSTYVFVITSTPGTVANGDRAQVDLIATAVTGSGAPGTSFAGQGQGGGNAVVGSTGGDGQDDSFLVVSSASVALSKSAVVTDQFGRNNPVPGATLTYTLTATVTGSGTASNLVISDPIPAGVTYVPGSITLGGTAKTDATDGDEAIFSTNTVTVNTGNVAGGQTRVVTFRAVIQ